MTDKNDDAKKPWEMDEPDDEAAEAASAEPANAEAEASPDDLLEDVRRSLIEEEVTDQSQKGSKWWSRLGRRAKTTAPETPPASAEIDLPDTLASAPVEQTAAASDDYAEQIDDLIDMLETKSHEPAVENALVPVVEEPAPESEPEIDFETLKEQALRPRAAAEGAEAETDVRSIALEGGEEVFVEVQSQTADPMDERLKSMENALRPYRRPIYLTLAFLGVVMAVVASLLIYNVYQQSRPQPVQVVPDLPYPTAVSLPGGWSFNLGRGTLVDGNWNPAGAEWLQGTEVCRWVSLPYSRQLEAVIRTLNPDDPIQLTMSNNDKLTYSVYSVYQMTQQEIQALDTNSPCLLLILTQTDSEKHWVLTALP